MNLITLRLCTPHTLHTLHPAPLQLAADRLHSASYTPHHTMPTSSTLYASLVFPPALFHSCRVLKNPSYPSFHAITTDTIGVLVAPLHQQRICVTLAPSPRHNHACALQHSIAENNRPHPPLRGPRWGYVGSILRSTHPRFKGHISTRR
jgi:hypothetical protein